jgi:sugar lactone lactonase YvrE
MMVAPSGDLYVSDGYRNSRVHRFSSQGALLDSWGKPGKQEPGEFHLPHSLWVDRQSQVYVCDRENSRIQVFTGAGKFVSQWRDIVKPTDICFDAQEIAYVSEQRPSISVLEKSGKVLARFDTPASGHGLWVDSLGDIYLASVGARKLIKYVHKR